MEVQETNNLDELNYTLSTPGWSTLLEEIEEELKATKDAFLYVEENNKLHFMRGKVSVLEAILNYKTKVENLSQGVPEEDADL